MASPAAHPRASRGMVSLGLGFLLLACLGVPEGRAHTCQYPPGFPLPHAPLNPCSAGCTDLTGDGSVDICDDLLFVADFTSNNLRSDFDSSQHVDLNDLAIYQSCYVASPAPVGVPGTATIGVYFDAAGTVSELHGVAFGDIVTLYVVAHGLVADMAAYTFGLDLGGALPTLSESPPPFAAGSYGLSDNTPDFGQCSRGAETYCASANGTVLLMEYQMSYYPLQWGPVNTVISVHGLDNHQTAWALPAYLACGGGCDLTYITLDPATGGRAVINPLDFNGNGLADLFESQGTRWYHIAGESTGVPWSVGVRASGGGSWHEEAACGPVASGSSAAAIVAELVARVDAIAGDNAGPEAGIVAWSPNAFWVSVPGGDAFELGVGAAGATYPGDFCWAPPSHFCEFNPTLTEIINPTSSVPTAAGFALGNFPNPFNPATTIAFTLPAAARVELAIYDLRGQLVRTLLAGRQLPAGRQECAWDGRDEQGNAAPAGAYLYRLQAGEYSEARSMMLVK